MEGYFCHLISIVKAYKFSWVVITAIRISIFPSLCFLGYCKRESLGGGPALTWAGRQSMSGASLQGWSCNVRGLGVAMQFPLLEAACRCQRGVGIGPLEHPALTGNSLAVQK